LQEASASCLVLFAGLGAAVATPDAGRFVQIRVSDGSRWCSGRGRLIDLFDHSIRRECAHAIAMSRAGMSNPHIRSYAAIFTSRALQTQGCYLHQRFGSACGSANNQGPGIPDLQSRAICCYSGTPPRSNRRPCENLWNRLDSGRSIEMTDMELLSRHAGYGCMSLWCVTKERAYPFVVLPRVFKRLLPGRATDLLPQYRGFSSICVGRWDDSWHCEESSSSA